MRTVGKPHAISGETNSVLFAGAVCPQNSAPRAAAWCIAEGIGVHRTRVLVGVDVVQVARLGRKLCAMQALVQEAVVVLHQLPEQL